MNLFFVVWCVLLLVRMLHVMSCLILLLQCPTFVDIQIRDTGMRKAGHGDAESGTMKGRQLWSFEPTD